MNILDMERKRDKLNNRIKKARKAEYERLRKQRTRQLIILGGDLKAISEKMLGIIIDNESIHLLAKFWDKVLYSKLTDENINTFSRYWYEYIRQENTRERSD